jgi:hypothetical protein
LTGPGRRETIRAMTRDFAREAGAPNEAGDATMTAFPRITTMTVFDPSPVTGWSSLPWKTRRQNAEGLTIDRVFEHGEVLSYVRLATSLVWPPSERNPAIREIRFNFGSAARPSARETAAGRCRGSRCRSASSPGARVPSRRSERAGAPPVLVEDVSERAADEVRGDSRTRVLGPTPGWCPEGSASPDVRRHLVQFRWLLCDLPPRTGRPWSLDPAGGTPGPSPNPPHPRPDRLPAGRGGRRRAGTARRHGC